jgi:hypothetical protein
MDPCFRRDDNGKIEHCVSVLVKNYSVRCKFRRIDRMLNNIIPEDRLARVVWLSVILIAFLMGWIISGGAYPATKSRAMSDLWYGFDPRSKSKIFPI